MRIVGVDHIQLAMPAGEEDKARAFYTGLLGIPERAKPATLAARGGAWFESAHVKIHLGVDGDFHPARKAHPGLLVADLAALATALGRAGYEVTEDPLEGRLRVYVNDPFGNRLELIEHVVAGPGAPGPLPLARALKAESPAWPGTRASCDRTPPTARGRTPRARGPGP